MLNFRKMGMAILAMALALVVVMPVAGDAHEPVIMPIDGAQFLPGAFFDFRVEFTGDTLPEDFAVTINGTPAEEIYGEGTVETHDEGAYTTATWRDLQAPDPGEYEINVTYDGEETSVTWTVREPQDAGASNVILFIADGGSVATNTATRLLSRGIEEGTYNDRLSFETFEEIGLLSTSGVDSIMTDSANSASAYNTGHKSSVNATGVYADRTEDAYDDPRVETFAELVTRTRGMSVGVVTTAYMQDATPAAVFGHSRERNSRSRSDFMQQAIGHDAALGTAFQVVNPEVWLGGGARYILPASAGSRRGDELNMFDVYEDNGYAVVTSNTQLQEAIDNGSERVLGVFADNNLSTWLDRNVYTENLGNNTDQPGLVDMTVAALEVLSQNENGFYLAVEAASIDKALHPMDFERALADSIEFDRAVAATVDWLTEEGLAENTLIVVTADHGHSFDVFGTVDVEAFNAAENDVDRVRSIGIYAGAGYPAYEDADGDFFPDSWDVPVTLAMGKVEHPPFTEDYQVSSVYRTPTIVTEDGLLADNPDDDPNGLTFNGNIPSTSSVHTLQDVPVYAQGPGAEFLGRSLENIEVFFAMANAIGLDPRDAMEMMDN